VQDRGTWRTVEKNGIGHLRALSPWSKGWMDHGLGYLQFCKLIKRGSDINWG